MPTGADDVQLMAISSHASPDEGDSIILSCVGSGQPSVDVTWMYDGNTLANDSHYTLYEKGEAQFKESYLRICDVGSDDIGSYTCTVGNGVRTDSSTADVTGEPLPPISSKWHYSSLSKWQIAVLINL